MRDFQKFYHLEGVLEHVTRVTHKEKVCGKLNQFLKKA
jgi:hypothetical protein